MRTILLSPAHALAVPLRAPYRPPVVGEEGTKIPVRRMTQAADFAALDSATVLHFAVLSGSDAARVVAAELESYLIDRADTLNDLNESERRASDETAFEFIRRLEGHGCVVCAGVDQAELRFDDDPSKTRAWPVGCIVISNLTDQPAFATVKNG